MRSKLWVGQFIEELKKEDTAICFSIHVAKLAQFPDHVIEFAKKRAQELEEFNNDDKGKENHGHGFASSVRSSVQCGESILNSLSSFRNRWN